MGQNASEYLVERLYDWGVRRIYGYPGDGINGLINALDVFEKIELVQVRHEEMAAFMATAHAKYTGEVGVCLATSGPGAIHLLNGLYDAKADHVPVLAIVGQAATSAIGSHYQQEVDLQTLFKDVAHEYCFTASCSEQIRTLTDRAYRIAKSMRAVTCIIVPKDVQEAAAVPSGPHAHNHTHTGLGYEFPHVVPTDESLRRAAEILNAGKKPAILVGAGALGATDEVIAVAERLGAGVAKALLGKAALPDTLPYVTGSIGLLGTAVSSYMMTHCDTLLMIGTSFPYSEFLPKEGQARGVQIDVEGRNLGLRYPTEVNLHGDAVSTLRALLPLLDQTDDVSWRTTIEQKRRESDAQTLAMAHASANPLNPQLIFTEFNDRSPANAIFSSDAGTATNWFARHVHMKRGQKSSLSGGLATMGAAVPYAIAAKFAYPDRPAICFTGDGAMQMNGTAEMLTVLRYWKQWSDPRCIFVVLNNRDLNQVTWELRVESGDPKFASSQNLPDFAYARYMEQIGLVGIRVDRPEDVGAAWDRALAADRPVLLEAYVDPEVPTLPPHISFEQARNLTKAFVKGDPDELAAMTGAAKQLLASVLPGRS